MSSPAFQFYPKDFLAVVMTWKADERGAYISLMSKCWVDGSLPNDPAELADIAAMSRGRFDAVWQSRLAKRFRVLEDGQLVEVELEKRQREQAEYREKKSKAGKKGAEAKWAKDGSAIDLPLADEQQVPVANDSPSSASASASSSASAKQEKRKRAAPQPQHPDFRAFTDAFQEAFQAANDGAKPTWEAKQRAAVERLLRLPGGLDEAVRRARNMFEAPPTWPPPPHDLLTLEQHFDRFAQRHARQLANGSSSPANLGPGGLRAMAQEFRNRGA